MNTAVKYLHVLDQTGIVGGSPQTSKPIRKTGRQAADSGSHNDVAIHRIMMLPNADRSLVVGYHRKYWPASLNNPFL